MARMWHDINRSVHEGMNDISNIMFHLNTRSGNVNIKNVSILLQSSMKFLFTTSTYPDEVQRYVASHLDKYCLSMSLKGEVI